MPVLRGACWRRSGRAFTSAPLVCEGGALNADGEGTVLTTEQCLLNPNRNPGRTREEVEEHPQALSRRAQGDLAGQRFSDTETDGHVDNIACFAGPGRVILGMPAAKAIPTTHRCRRRAAVEVRDATRKGAPSKSFALPQPKKAAAVLVRPLASP